MFVSNRFPLGIGYIASYLERELDMEIGLFDCVAEQPNGILIDGMIRWGCDDQAIKRKIEEFAPDFVGVSQMFSYLDKPVRNIFSIAKETNPNIINIWGGTHPTIAPNECLEFDDVDYLILGEGEAPIKSLIKTLNEDGDISTLKSLGYKDENGEIFVNNQREWIQNLDEHVLPARDKVNFASYLGANKEANIVTSRGCPFSCTFCTAPAFYQKRYNGRSPELVVDEIEHLHKDHGVQKFIIQDENISFQMDRIEGIADEIIRRKLDIKWYAEAGTLIARLNPKLIEKMAKSGIMAINLPVESGDQSVLKKMAKPLKLSKVMPIVEACREHHVRVRSFLLLGMPGETGEQREMTKDFAHSVGFDWNYLSLLQPLPGTEVFEELKAAGTEFKIDEVERFIVPPKHGMGYTGEELLQTRHNFNIFLNFENNFNLLKGNLSVALTDFEDIANRYPNVAHIHHYLGLARYKNMDLTGALTSFLKAVETAKAYPTSEGPTLNASDWIDALKYSLSVSENMSSYLERHVETSLDYKYGHIDANSVFSASTVEMGYKVASLEEMHGASLV
ncbi:B12-binding domain-containing radical SAM protein [Rhodospirillales bacterium]|nr:B12-binding domain-containing radical SAM protein [Rhodospirillales bacterium]